MKKINSENKDILDFLKDKNYRKITLDIETLDSSILELWNEPVISFSVTFIPNNPNITTHFPTFGFCAESEKEEKDLLSQLVDILNKLNNKSTLVGHNIAYELECKKKGGWSHFSGYDIPKILNRSKLFDLNLEVIKKFKTYDTMDVAYLNFKHSDHGILRNGQPKKILSSEELENLFRIVRPKNIPKLGPKVRDYFKDGRLDEILLYNCSDTLIETIFYTIFEHKLNVCKNKECLISHKDNCNHIPQIIEIQKLGTWKLLERGNKKV